MPSVFDVSCHYFPPAQPSSPALAFQVTRLVDSYMVWAGITEESEENVHITASQGRLAYDWACAMPSLNPGTPPAATSLFRPPNTDVALPLAQKLARRFNKQIFLSVDLPPAFVNLGQWPMLILNMEKRAIDVLKTLEDSSTRTE